MISFAAGTPNQLLINPRLSEAEKSVLYELKTAFEKSFETENYFLIPSSGSSKAADQSVKLIALTVESVLNSARRVNFYLNAARADRWGLFLPDFHVAGLGVRARAFLAGTDVISGVFSVKEFAGFLQSENISFLSLVPAQIFDLVSAGVHAPSCVKKVFVGGGILNPQLRRRINDLGWPVTETFGMTETASMVATRERDDSYFTVMPGVSVKVEDQVLHLKCDSLLTATIQKSGEQLQILPQDSSGWLQTEDLATVYEKENGTFLELHGRKSEYIKILGEGVSLSELRNRLSEFADSLGLDPRHFELTAVDHERSGHQIILVTEEVMEAQRQDLLSLFNAACRPYERITKTIVLRQIPRTDLGKLKTAELKRIIKNEPV